MKCPNCNSDLMPDAKFCPSCGAKVETNEVKEGEVVQNQNTNNSGNTAALVGFILGLCSIIAWFIPLFGYPVTIVGIIFSVLGLKSNIRKGMATVGLVLSIIFLVITLINSLAGCLMVYNNLI